MLDTLGDEFNTWSYYQRESRRWVKDDTNSEDDVAFKVAADKLGVSNCSPPRCELACIIEAECKPRFFVVRMSGGPQETTKVIPVKLVLGTLVSTGCTFSDGLMSLSSGRHRNQEHQDRKKSGCSSEVSRKYHGLCFLFVPWTLLLFSLLDSIRKTGIVSSKINGPIKLFILRAGLSQPVTMYPISGSQNAPVFLFGCEEVTDLSHPLYWTSPGFVDTVCTFEMSEKARQVQNRARSTNPLARQYGMNNLLIPLGME